MRNGLKDHFSRGWKKKMISRSCHIKNCLFVADIKRNVQSQRNIFFKWVLFLCILWKYAALQLQNWAVFSFLFFLNNICHFYSFLWHNVVAVLKLHTVFTALDGATVFGRIICRFQTQKPTKPRLLVLHQAAFTCICSHLPRWRSCSALFWDGPSSFFYNHAERGKDHLRPDGTHYAQYMVQLCFHMMHNIYMYMQLKANRKSDVLAYRRRWYGVF